MDRSFTEPALAVLYILQESKVALSNEQLNDVLTLSSNMTYIDMKIGLTEMLDKGFVEAEQSPAGEFYSLSFSGRILIAEMKTDLKWSIRNAISQYIREHATQLRLEAKLSSRVLSSAEGTYLLHLKAFDDDMGTSEILLSVNDRDEAKQIERNWKKYGDEAISALYSVLIRDE